MATEPKTGLTFWPPGAMQPDLLFNALLYWLAAWAQPIVLAIEDDPPGSPAEGDAYLVGVGTDAWAGHDDSLAYWDGTTWLFFAPMEGYEARNLDTGDLLVYEGSGGWSVAPGGLSDAPIDGTGYVRKDGAWEPEAGGGGSGDVVGPASSIDSRVALFDGTTGKLLKQAGKTFDEARIQCIPIACSDETTALTTGAAKVTFRMPYAFTLLSGAAGARASLTTAQTSGSIFTVDINEGGTTILSTKLTIDNTEKTSTTAATPAVISDTSLADDAEITIDIDQIGDGTAKGLKVYLIGYPT